MFEQRSVVASLMLAFLAHGGCKRPTSTVPTPQSSMQRSLRATLNGNRVLFASALARTRRDGRVEVRVSTRPLTCALFDQEPGGDEIWFGLELVQKLLPDGVHAWRVECVEFEGTHSCADAGHAVDARLNTQTGAKAGLEIEDMSSIATELTREFTAEHSASIEEQVSQKYGVEHSETTRRDASSGKSSTKTISGTTSSTETGRPKVFIKRVK